MAGGRGIPPGERTWLDEPRTGRIVFWALAVVCAGLALADFSYHKHYDYGWEAWPGFHGLFGFVSCFFLVIAARGLRRFVMRDEDYHDRDDR